MRAIQKDTQTHLCIFRMRVLLLVVCNVDYTNLYDVGKQNSNGRIEDDKILVEFIVFYMSLWLPLWSVAGRDEYYVTLWLTGNG